MSMEVPLNMRARRGKLNRERLGKQWQGGTNQKRAWTLRGAIEILTSLPRFHSVNAAMLKATEALVREMGTVPPPRLQAFRWLDIWAKSYLALVTDLPSWRSFHTLLNEVAYPEARTCLFGFPNVIPQSQETIKLLNRLDGKVRDWQQKASAKLARQEPGQAQRPAKRRHGFPAAVEQHQIVLAEVRRYGDDWRDHLPEICRALNGKVPKPASSGASTWVNIGDDLEWGDSRLRERVRKYLQYRINWAKKTAKGKVSRSVSKSR
jgi:hypothetical protein